MRLSDFDFYRDFLMEKSGVELTQDKAFLLDSRLTPIARQWGYPNIGTLTMAMRGVPPSDMVRDVIEAMTTNETSFFRDLKPFYHFRDVVFPTLMKERKNKGLRIWSAGCSTGQEPYSLAMLLKEIPKQGHAHFDIVATDLSTDVLETAMRGDYTQSEVQRGLSVHLLLKYFDQRNGHWCLKQDIKSMVQFRPFNLMEPMKSLGGFDVVLCRNVLSYFDRDTRVNVLHNIIRTMTDDGVLYLGIDETAEGLDDVLKPMENAKGVFILRK